MANIKIQAHAIGAMGVDRFIEEYNPVDGQFLLVFTPEGRMIAKAWNREDARLIATVFNKA